MTTPPPLPPPEDRARYYRDADSWNRDREAASRNSRRIAWIAASVATLIALAEACALVALTPLKTVVPYTLLVDRQTGYVEALDPLKPARIGADTALTQSFVVQYVIARESYDVAEVQANYRKVAAWSEGTARARYIAAMQASNPASPLVALPRTTVIETRVKSVSPVGTNALLVRFDTQRRDQDGRPYPAQPWVAVVRYRYTGEPMTLAERFLNPLGFRVTQYRRDAEALVPDADPPAARTVPSTAAADDPTPTTLRYVAPYAATGSAGPSPLLSVRRPRYVTTFPGPDGPPPGSVIGVDRRGRPIVGPTRANGGGQ